MRFRPVLALMTLLACALAAAQKSPVPIGPPSRVGLGAGQWKVVTVSASDWHSELRATLRPTIGNADLYVRLGQAPTLTQYDAHSANPVGEEIVVLDGTSNPTLRTGTYYIGIYAVTNCLFTSMNAVSSKASTRPGMGAVPYAGGVTFRVWTPFSTQVSVPGSFNGWNTSAAKLVPEGGGVWSLDYRNVQPGAQYKFYLTTPFGNLWRNDPRAKDLTSSVGNSVVHNPAAYQWQTSSFQTPAWNDLVVYETHIGTLNDTPGGSPGTFASAEARLDYLASMGVNCIQLMPIQEFPGDFSWGYNNSYPFSVESAYGSPDQLKRLIDQANARGIAVLFDVVHNHYGPNDMDLWRFDGWFQGQWGGSYFYNDQRGRTDWGWTRPDYGRQEVRQYILDSQRMWAEEYRVSGFRWDSTLYMRVTDWGANPEGWSLLQWLNNDLDARQPWKINIAEDLQGDASLTRDTSQGGAGFDSQWSGFVHTLKGLMSATWDNDRNMFSLRDALNERFNGDAFERVVYTESHDENANGRQRPPSEIDAANPGSYWARKRSTLGAAAMFTAPGVPMLFQGQEILEDGYFADTDPVDWSKLTTYAGINLFYKDMIRLRRNLAGTTRGLKGQGMNVFHVNNSDKVVAFHRWDQGGSGDDVVVVMNWANATRTNYQIGIPRAGAWSVALNSDWNGYSSDFGNTFQVGFQASSTPRDGLGYSAGINLGPYSCLVLSKD